MQEKRAIKGSKRQRNNMQEKEAMRNKRQSIHCKTLKMEKYKEKKKISARHKRMKTEQIT
jgi:hypothetical protein